MKKIIIILLFIFAIFTFVIFNLKENKEEVIEETKEVKVIKEKNKEKVRFLTNNYDHIDEVLKEEFVEEVVINYIIEELPKKNGFFEEEGNTYYYEDDIKVIGEKIIDNDEYYFNEDGVLQKDIMIDNKYYDEEGKKYIGFKTIDNNTYYFEKEGYVIGEKKIDEDIFYFDENGIMITNKILDNMYFDDTGKRKFGEIIIDNKMYYLNEDGFAKDIFIDNKYYDINGEYVDGFYIENGNVYYKYNGELAKGVRLLNNVRYYFDFETGILKEKNINSVIDISTWQGDINFDELKNSNLVDAVIVRIGFGSLKGEACTLDNKFERNIAELKRLNIPYGIYFFGYAQNEFASEVEANFVKEVIEKYDLNLSFPIFYDAELQTFNGVTYTKTLYRKVINKFIDVLNQNGYKDVGVYGNLYMLTKGGLSSIKNSIPKWVAQYFKECQYEKEYIGWQYTSSGNIPGINGRVDMNIFY